MRCTPNDMKSAFQNDDDDLPSFIDDNPKDAPVRASSMFSAARHTDVLSGRRNTLKADGARRSDDAPSHFKFRQLNAQAPSFSQWSLAPGPPPPETAPGNHVETASRPLAQGEYIHGPERLPRHESIRVLSPSVTWNQRRMSAVPNPQPIEDGAEGVAPLFNQCTRTLPSSHELISALELKSLVGVGSMGTVYLATLLGQQVVCKVIEHDNSVAFSRVKDRRSRAALEGQLGRLLSHPNIVAGYGAFSGHFPASKLCVAGNRVAGAGPVGVDGRVVTLLLQEFCAGGPLRSALQKNKLYADCTVSTAGAAAAARAADEQAPLWRLKVLAQVASQVAAGLAHMHALNIVHCDLNASNVFLHPVASENLTEGALGVVAKIGDLGIAHIVPPGKDDGGIDAAAAGSGMHGTVSHMPPEALASTHALAPCTDIWSFGMLLWELWTLQVPFADLPPQEVVQKVLAHDLPTWPPEAPPVLVQVCERCWNPDSANRPNALALATTFAKLAAVLQEADALQQPQQALAGRTLNKTHMRGHSRSLPSQTAEDDLEDALIDGTLDVELLQSVHSDNDSLASGSAVEALPRRLEECQEPPADDNVAQLLWRLLHPAEPAECVEVRITPLRSVVVAPLPYLNSHKYLEQPQQL
eukprot:jgi/Ulvmu1/11252/UM073_0024.1